MAGGYQVGIASETKAFKQGIESGVIDPLEDAQKELLELGKNRGPEQLERQLKDDQKASEKLADETKRTADAIDREYRDSYRKMKTSSEDAYDKASEGAENFKEEAGQTAREAAASFDGSASSIGDAFQELAANAFAGFGPAGAVAGIAAAAGIGLATAGFDQVGDASEASRQRAAEWAQAFVEAGGRVLDAATTTAKQVSIATDPDKYKEATENAKNWGVDVSTAIAAMAGETWALDAAHDSLARSSKKISDEMSEVGLQYDWAGESMDELYTRTAAGERSLKSLNGEMEQGAKQAADLSESLRKTAANTKGAISKVDEFGDTVTTLPDGTTIYIDAETGQATVDTQAIEDKIYGIRDKSVTITANTTIDRSQYDAFVQELHNKTIKIKGRIVTTPDGWE